MPRYNDLSGWIFNNNSADADFRVAGVTEPNMVYVDANIDTVYLGGLVRSMEVAKGGIVTLQGVGSLIQSSNFVSGTAGWRIDNYGSAEFENITARGFIKTAVFIKSLVLAFAGSQVVAKSASTIAADCTLAGSTFTLVVRLQAGAAPFASGDLIYIKTESLATYATVDTGAASGANWSYTATYKSGSNSGTVSIGETVIDYGIDGDGRVWITADSTNAPYISIATHDMLASPTWTERVRVGKLTGIVDTNTNPSGYGIWTDNGYFKGVIVADSGRIGGTAGWQISAGLLKSGSGASTVGLNSDGVNPAIYAGSATPSLAPFKVMPDGTTTLLNAIITPTAGSVIDGSYLTPGTVIASKLSVVAGGSNLVRNSSFQVDTNNDGLADNWITWNDDPGSNPITTTVVTSGGVDGRAHQRIAWSSPNAVVKGIRMGVNMIGIGVQGGFVAGTTYIVSWWAKMSSLSAAATTKVSFDGPVTITYLLQPNLTTAWQQYVARVLYGVSGDTNGAIYFYLDAAVSGIVEFDHVQVERADVPSFWKPFPAEIEPGAIVANMILAGTITGTQIAAGTLTANHLVVTAGGSNLLANSSFQIDADANSIGDGWALYNNGPEVIDSYSIQSSGGVDNRAFQRIIWSSANTSTKGLVASNSATGGIVSGWSVNTTYIISWWAKTPSMSGTASVLLAWNTPPVSVTWLLNPSLSSTWQRYAQRIVTGNSVEGDGRLYLTASTGVYGTLDLDHVQVEQADLVSAWKPYPAEIEPGSITGDKIYGTTLSAIRADLGTITAGTITGGTIRTAASGARIELNATKLFGTNGTTEQFYVNAADGKFYAGGGSVSLESAGIIITGAVDASNPKYIQFIVGTTGVGSIYANIISAHQYFGIDVDEEFLVTSALGSNRIRLKYGSFQVGESGYPTSFYAFNYSEFNSSNGDYDTRIKGDTDSNLFLADAGTDRIGIGTGTPSAKLHVLQSDSGTSDGPALVCITRNSTGTPANGFGTGVFVSLETTTTGAQNASYIQTTWYDATHATRKADMAFLLYDATTYREALRLRTDGSVAAVGFYGVTPAVRPTAYTQTYSTASRTVSAPTAATLTDSTGGTANTTLEVVGATYSQSVVRNNFADLAAMVNKNTADQLVLIKVVTQIIDDLQAVGLLA